MNNGCSLHGFSIVPSAGMDSQIAGVLAGFVFTGIVLLLGRRGPKSIQTLCLFSATFVALGFDSHLWGVISGGNADLICARLWSEAMAAAGLLAVGATAIVTGISWLLFSHLDQVVQSEDGPGVRQSDRVLNLSRFVRFMAYGVSVTVTLLLAATTKDFLSAAFRSHVPTALAWMAMISPALVIILSAGLAILGRIWCARDMGITPFSLCNTGLGVAAYGMLVYAVAGPVFGGVVVQLGAQWWQPTSGVIVGAAIAVGLAIPALLVIALVQAVPPLFANASDVRSDIGSAKREAPSTAPPENTSSGVTTVSSTIPLSTEGLPDPKRTVADPRVEP